MLYNISCDLDEIVLDVVAAKHILDQLCEIEPPKGDAGNLHGGLQRALWLVLDSIKDNLEAMSEATFKAATEAKKQQPEA